MGIKYFIKEIEKKIYINLTCISLSNFDINITIIGRRKGEKRVG